MIRRCLSACLVLAGAAGAPAASEPALTVETERGASVSVMTDLPSGDPPFPALVVAPGGGYPASAPLHAELAAAAAAAGYLVYRLDWAYWTAGASASRAG